MTIKQVPSTEPDSDVSDLFAATTESIDAPFADVSLPSGAVAVSFGSRLCAAREARGLDLAGCSSSLKLSVRVLRQLESDRSDGVDSKVYLASYIATYARYLGIDEPSIQAEVNRIQQIEAPLIATGGISHSRFLLDRYATAATYVVLTAVLVVPMIWLGVRGTLDRDLSRLAPLDAVPVAQQDTRAINGVGDATVLAAVATPPAPVVQTRTLLASMAPFPNMDDAPVPAATPAANVAVGSGDHQLTLNLAAASWVEVLDQDGSRLEYGLLPAGSDKTYRSDQALNVRIGNANGAQVSVDGQALNLEDFQHANVAHFRVQVKDGKASTVGL
ncbi:MAG: RodZ domain-containing protein [Rhodanobacter sp.]